MIKFFVSAYTPIKKSFKAVNSKKRASSPYNYPGEDPEKVRGFVTKSMNQVLRR